MAFTYYYRITINPHIDDRMGHPTADDVIYLKSLSPIELLPDASRTFTDGIFTDGKTEIKHNPPVIERITSKQYNEREKRMKELFRQSSKKSLENTAKGGD